MPLFGDLRSALRILARSPAYALTSTAVLALGIGVNVAIFSVVHSVVLAPLPYPDASRLVFIWQRLTTLSDPILGRSTVFHKNYLEWQRQNTVFEETAAFSEKSLDETSIDHPRHVSTAFASANFFRMLGVQVRMGRTFLPRDEDVNNNRVTIIADAFYERHFHRDPSVLGKTLTLNGDVYSVIGVLPPRFPFASHARRPRPTEARSLGTVIQTLEQPKGRSACSRFRRCAPEAGRAAGSSSHRDDSDRAASRERRSIEQAMDRGSIPV